MSYPKPKIANSEIDLKLGIKSSLPNATQAIVLSYLIWTCGDKKSQISYSKQTGDGLSLKDDLAAKISNLLQKNVEKFDKSVLARRKNKYAALVSLLGKGITSYLGRNFGQKGTMN